MLTLSSLCVCSLSRTHFAWPSPIKGRFLHLQSVCSCSSLLLIEKPSSSSFYFSLFPLPKQIAVYSKREVMPSFTTEEHLIGWCVCKIIRFYMLDKNTTWTTLQVINSVVSCLWTNHILLKKLARNGRLHFICKWCKIVWPFISRFWETFLSALLLNNRLELGVKISPNFFRPQYACSALVLRVARLWAIIFKAVQRSCDMSWGTNFLSPHTIWAAAASHFSASHLSFEMIGRHVT